jgi:hypothetical protein
VRDPKERLRDILEAIAAIDRYRDRDRSAFDQDEMLQVWFLRHLQIIEEAASRLPEGTRNLDPDIRWHKIIGLLMNLIVVMPPEPLARLFADVLNIRRRVSLMKESRTLAALRDALLPKLIRGEIRVKDAERFVQDLGGERR